MHLILFKYADMCIINMKNSLCNFDDILYNNTINNEYDNIYILKMNDSYTCHKRFYIYLLL